MKRKVTGILCGNTKVRKKLEELVSKKENIFSSFSDINHFISEISKIDFLVFNGDNEDLRKFIYKIAILDKYSIPIPPVLITGRNLFSYYFGSVNALKSIKKFYKGYYLRKIPFLEVKYSEGPIDYCFWFMMGNMKKANYYKFIKMPTKKKFKINLFHDDRFELKCERYAILTSIISKKNKSETNENFYFYVPDGFFIKPKGNTSMEIKKAVIDIDNKLFAYLDGNMKEYNKGIIEVNICHNLEIVFPHIK